MKNPLKGLFGLRDEFVEPEFDKDRRRFKLIRNHPRIFWAVVLIGGLAAIAYYVPKAKHEQSAQVTTGTGGLLEANLTAEQKAFWQTIGAGAFEGVQPEVKNLRKDISATNTRVNMVDTQAQAGVNDVKAQVNSVEAAYKTAVQDLSNRLNAANAELVAIKSKKLDLDLGSKIIADEIKKGLEAQPKPVPMSQYNEDKKQAESKFAQLFSMQASAQGATPALGDPRRVQTTSIKQPEKTSTDLQARAQAVDMAAKAYDNADRIAQRCGLESSVYKNKENWPTPGVSMATVTQFLDANCPAGSQKAAPQEQSRERYAATEPTRKGGECEVPQTVFVSGLGRCIPKGAVRN